MRLRIAIWAVAGALAVLSWSLCFMAFPGSRLGDVWALVYLTIPISIVRQTSHPVGLYSVLVVNAATYALVGTAVEMVRRYARHARAVHPQSV